MLHHGLVGKSDADQAENLLRSSFVAQAPASDNASCQATVSQLQKKLAAANKKLQQFQSDAKKAAPPADEKASISTLKKENEALRKQLEESKAQLAVKSVIPADADAVKKENEALRKQLEESKAQLAAKSLSRDLQTELQPQASAPFHLPASIQHYAVQMVTLPKMQFLSHFNFQLPLDESRDDVTLIYSSYNTLPDGVKPSENPFTHMESTEDAVKNCDFLNLIMTANHGNRQCVALVPNWESHHIHKFARVDMNRSNDRNKVNSSLPLIPVSRSTRDDGIHRLAPELTSLKKSWTMMTSYLQQLPKSLEALEPLLQKIAVNNAVIIMVTNFGQAELLLNFHCSAKARNLTVSNILVIALDESTKDLASSIGYTVFYDEVMFGHIPAEKFGREDALAVAFMAKVQAAHMACLLGYDVLYQDVDVIWYRDPLAFFVNATGPYSSHDAVFNDDGSRSKRFMTYFANAGYYFIRSNVRTRAFLNRWVTSAELTFQYSCDQEVLNIVLSEGRSLFGLDVAVISRDENTFLSGYHFHMEDPRANTIQRMMVQQYQARNRTAVAAKEKEVSIQPYILHMHFTANKEFKRKFYSQLGEWRVHDQCIQADPAEVIATSRRQDCCVKEPPAIKCFYRNRPSAIPCHDSPPVPESFSTGSFWE
jgi:Nucleotide-diphospho-sugar transferase